MLLFSGTVVGIDDDAGFFPGLEEAVAGFAAAEPEGEVVEEGGETGLDVLEEGLRALLSNGVWVLLL